jgi:Glycosyl hydrolase family 65 central catalytic domain
MTAASVSGSVSFSPSGATYTTRAEATPAPGYFSCRRSWARCDSVPGTSNFSEYCPLKAPALKITSPSTTTQLLHHHPLELYRQQVIKQTDVVLATYLVGHHFSEDEIRRTFDYYDPLTTGDSTLSACIQSVIASEVGYPKAALEYFVAAARSTSSTRTRTWPTASTSPRAAGRGSRSSPASRACALSTATSAFTRGCPPDGTACAAAFRSVAN